MKLVLFQTSEQAEATPGLLTERGVVSLTGTVERGHTPQLTMQAFIDDFDRLRPALERLAAEGAALLLSTVRLRAPLPRPGKILCCIANYWEHAQREARPLNMFLKNPDAVVGPRDTIILPEFNEPWIFMHEAELGSSPKAPPRTSQSRLEERRVRLYWPDRRVGAPREAHMEFGLLDRQIIRHLRAGWPVYRDRRRNSRARRPGSAVLERR